VPKILIIRFSSIGDIVLTTPVIRCIKQQVKNAEVHFLTKRSFENILSSNPYVDKVYSIDKNVSEITEQLRAEKYDEIIDLHNNLRTAEVKMKLKVRSHSFNKINAKKWFHVNFKADCLPEIHIVDRYLETVKHLEVINDNKGLDYFIPEKDKVPMSLLPASHRNGYTAFVIGAKHFTKQLPTEKIISICKKLDQPVILLGGKEDVIKAEMVSIEVGKTCFNSCGKFNLNQSASIVKQSIAVISHDTGLMHIAAALKKKIISVWGSTVPEFGMYPYLPAEGSEAMEMKGLPCRPCTKIGYETCPLGHFKCMNLIDENKIAALLN
jgi:ADP-heptose:LPS heptosyltransferase